MPYEQPDHLPEDMDELDLMVARAYSQGIDTGKRSGRNELKEELKKFLEREFNASKGRRRLANREDPKTAAVLEIMEKLYGAFEEGTL